ncbi:hypothetical protein GGX14DRAFT_401102 [Mycena pura]|uniref:Uncharacterized protein n=1 Tax=Mycena pura TaxID=153505 RepID=A0AAD6V1A2_9AGAR|nr:hypothetical protein GGX14DRAFT_401102 [Mycena pura]
MQKNSILALYTILALNIKNVKPLYHEWHIHTLNLTCRPRAAAGIDAGYRTLMGACGAVTAALGVETRAGWCKTAMAGNGTEPAHACGWCRTAVAGSETEPAHAPVSMRGRCRVAAWVTAAPRVETRAGVVPGVETRAGLVQSGGRQSRTHARSWERARGAQATAQRGVLQRGSADARGIARRRCGASTGGRSVARRRHGALLGGGTGHRQVVAAAQGVASGAGRPQEVAVARSGNTGHRQVLAAAQGVARRSWWRGSSPGGRGVARRRHGRRPAVAAVRGVDRWSWRRASPGVSGAGRHPAVAAWQRGASPGGRGGAGRRQAVAASPGGDIVHHPAVRGVDRWSRRRAGGRGSAGHRQAHGALPGGGAGRRQAVAALPGGDMGRRPAVARGVAGGSGSAGRCGQCRDKRDGDVTHVT